VRRTILLTLWFAMSCGTIATVTPPKGAVPPFPAPAIERVFVVVLENKDAGDALRQPFLGRLAKEGAYLANYYAVAHPSQPNYIALISGSIRGVGGDGNVDLDRPHLGDALDAAGTSWKSYAEQFPGHCDLRRKAGRYVRRHEPFLSFADVQRRPESCGRIVNAAELDRDLAAGQLPRFALYIPDLDNDGHDKPLAYADAQMEKRFGPLLKDPEFTRGLLLVVTFDEDDSHVSRRDNHIYTILWGSSVQPGAVSHDVYDHYDLLRTFEEIFHLPPSPKDAPDRPIAGVWR
jgi:phosphoesterase family protein